MLHKLPYNLRRFAKLPQFRADHCRIFGRNAKVIGKDGSTLFLLVRDAYGYRVGVVS